MSVKPKNAPVSKTTISSLPLAKVVIQTDFDWPVETGPDRNSIAWAASVLNRAAGYITGEARPPIAEVERAIDFLRKESFLDFAEASFAAKEALPTKSSKETLPEYAVRFRNMSIFQTDLWWRATCSGKSVCVPASATNVFIQDAGGSPGIVIPPEKRIVLPTLFARNRCRVIQKSTGQTVIPRVTVRGGPTVEIEGGGECHWAAIERSGLEVVGGWIKRGGKTPPTHTDDEADGGQTVHHYRQPK